MDLSEIVVPESSIRDFLRGVERPRIVPWTDSMLLTGIRFIGKTTCVYRRALEKGYIVISGDLASLYGISAKELISFLRRFRKVAIDEIHLINDRDTIFKALYDMGVKIIGTGSSILALRSSADFARRIRPYNMHTMSSRERLYVASGILIDLSRRSLEELYSKASSLDLDQLYSLKQHGEAKLLFFGGFPASLIMDPLSVKEGVRNTLIRTIERDLGEDRSLISSILRCIAERPGAVGSCVKEYYGKVSRRKINRALELLEASRLAYRVHIGDLSSKNVHRYFTDPAFYLIYGVNDPGVLLEAAIGYALYARGYKLIRPGGRSRSRPDFIAISPKGRLKIEIKHGDERPLGYDYVFYGGYEVKRVGGTTFIPRYLAIRPYTPQRSSLRSVRERS